MRKSKDTTRLVVAIEVTGFFLVLLVVWLDELVDLPHLLFGAPRSPARLAEATLESVSVLLVCACIVVGTIRLLHRIQRLESFVILCAWCRKVKVDERWVTFEEFLSEKEDLKTSHGICRSCAEKEKELLNGNTLKKE